MHELINNNQIFFFILSPFYSHLKGQGVTQGNAFWSKSQMYIEEQDETIIVPYIS